MKKNRIIIAGSRNCPEESNEYLNKVSKIIENLNPKEVEIVSGTCKGADKLGEWIASKLGINIVRFPADWNNLGKSAGYIRNKEMAEYSTHLIAFYNGKSRGTKLMLGLAEKHGLKVRVIKII